MKILCEVPLQVKQYNRSQFDWLAGQENYLFSFEDRKRLRMFTIQQEAGRAREVQSASLAESRLCTSLSWNRDQSLLALVVDRRQIYFWEVKRNNFIQFKPRSLPTTSQASMSNVSTPQSQNHGGGGRKANKSKDIDFVAWSKLTDKLVICFASGQILLCKLAISNNDYSSEWERFIDNSESVLKRILAIEVSEQAEVFACFSVISEILVMTFDGQTKFYSQGDRSVLLNAKFSPLHREHCPRSGQYLGQTVWFAYQSESESGIYLKKISLDLDLQNHDAPPNLHLANLSDSQGLAAQGDSEADKRVTLVDFHWLDSSHLLLCLSSGSIQLVQLVPQNLKPSHASVDPASDQAQIFRDHAAQETSTLSTELVLINPGKRLEEEEEVATLPASRASQDSSVHSQRETRALAQKDNELDEEEEKFKAFELIRTPKRGQDASQCFALAAATNYMLYYYEILGDPLSQLRFSIEHLDDIDLSESLRRVGLKLERIRWSRDCSMLSLQLTSGHLLVYRTRLQDLMVSSHGPHTAYLSAPNEVTILNYGASATQNLNSHRSPSPATTQDGQESQSARSQTTDHAIILNVQLKPSLLVIGPQHLAAALNNRVRFYPLNQAPEAKGNFDEQEYVTIVTGISLSSRFVAVHFDDGRLKLHSLRRPDAKEPEDDERFFPDPTEPETISSFKLTEELLVYCTRELKINIFSLKSWSMVQVCDHSGTRFPFPVERLKPNERGNKFVCLLETMTISQQRCRIQQDNLFLYDLYSNGVFGLVERDEAEDLWPKLVKAQIRSTFKVLPLPDADLETILRESQLLPPARPKQLTNVIDVVWDTDGRTLLLIETKAIHVFAILNHTLKQEEPICEYAATARKPSSYTTIYVSQGIVSFQTSLGRVINLVLETHDDDLKLTELEDHIQAIQVQLEEAAVAKSRQQQLQTGAECENEQCSINTAENESRIGAQAGDEDETLIFEAHLKVILLKLAYLCTILPVYSLPKCRDICKHLMEDKMLNLADDSAGERRGPYKLVDQMIWRILAAWSLHTLNLEFGSLIYRRNNLLAQAKLLTKIQDDIRWRRLDSRHVVVQKILRLLGCGDLDSP